MSTYVVTLFVVLFTTVSLAFQILAVITVPLTGNLKLSDYSNSAYGVFGWCYVNTDRRKECMAPNIGYVDVFDGSSVRQVNLPSRLQYSFTKLLIVHPLSAVITFVLWIMVLLILSPSFRSSPKYLLVVAIYSTPAFLCCLLAFLIDILLFISHLALIGWLVLASTIMLAVCCSLLWTLRRSASTKKYEALYSDDRISSIETYSICDVKPITDSLRPNSIEDTGAAPLLEPGLTYRGSLD